MTSHRNPKSHFPEPFGYRLRVRDCKFDFNLFHDAASRDPYFDYTLNQILLEFAPMRWLAGCLLLLLTPMSIGAWGEKGHLMINRLALDAAAGKLPEFMIAAL